MRDLLRDEILSGVHGSGALPSESDLSARFIASRNSVREALDLLRGEGILQRVRGAGTFVVRTKAMHHLDRLQGMAESQVDGRRRVTIEVLEVDLIRAPFAVATKVDVEPWSEVVLFERRLDLDSEPLSLWTSYMPSDIAGGLMQGNAGIDFYELVEDRFGMQLGSADFVTEARLADASLARVLDVDVGAPILFIERLLHDRDGRPNRLGNRAARQARVAELLDRVGLSAAHAKRFPHQLSGGQRQRVAIARAIAASPRLIVADEPVSALDLSTQAQVLNLFRELQAELGLATVFITHDLAVAEYLADRVIVMYAGRAVEEAPTASVFRESLHPYTEALAAAAVLEANVAIIDGEPPNPRNLPPGCAFHPRCPRAIDLCRAVRPELEAAPGRSGSRVACHLAGESVAGRAA
jgi:oligopeptide/dipeptide ABC transporter ATP-binding protein